MRFVDTNVFIRPLTNDDPAKARACQDFLLQVDRGEVEVTTCEAIISEVACILSSRATYGMSHAEIRARFAPYLRMRGLRLPGKSVFLEALDLFAANPALDFEDTVCVAHMRQAGITEILSYDRHLDHIPGIRRIEP
jgi:predicted nucleic acid-binding protein